MLPSVRLVSFSSGFEAVPAERDADTTPGKMSAMELNSSLTRMDWLARLNVGKNGKMAAPSEPPRSARPQPRKPPPSPIDLTARLDPLEAQAYRYHDAKPPYSYAALITFAINSSPRKKMTLSDIYNWISSNFPYYRDAGTGWKVRLLRREWECYFSHCISAT